MQSLKSVGSSQGETKMRYLLVEDEKPSLERALKLIAQIDPDASIVVASDRTGAERILNDDQFDLLICDLRIPSEEGAVDASDQNGLAVQLAAKRAAPGMPMLFLTAFATTKNMKNPLASGAVGAVFDRADFPMVQLCEKTDFDEFRSILSDLSASKSRLEAVAFSGNVAPDSYAARAARMYAKRTGMQSVTAAHLGGLSGAEVLRLSLVSDQGIAGAIIKTGSSAKMLDEYARYSRIVSNRMLPGEFAPYGEPISTGLGSSAALVLTLADPDSRSLFSILNDDPSKGVAVLAKLRGALDRLGSGAQPEDTSVAQLRASWGKVSVDARGAGIDLEIEAIRLSIVHRTIHGDLHGENILVTSDGLPVLIDFGDVRYSIAPLDPMTLELSLFFHPKGPHYGSKSAGLDFSKWSDVSEFSVQSPVGTFMEECRAWAIAIAGEEGMLAAAYAHALRQLKYPDTNHEAALAIASSAAAALKQTQH